MPDLYYRNRRLTPDRSTYDKVAWREWVITGSITSSNSTTAVTFADTVWHEWNASGTSTRATYRLSYDLPETIWSGQQMVAAYDRCVALTPQPTVEEVQARCDARDAAAAEERARREAQVALQAAATAKAEELLVSCLDQEQQAELAESDQFHVTSSAGRRFCIHRGRAGNVSFGAGRERVTYCIHDNEGLPAADTMLAQKLLLETDEAQFLQIANATRAW